ncbi:S4 domain-containing protein [Pedobacter sp. JY14-1]|uniref:S4 domain-containing protein n=1 Tax=Pedobacter sp. JY14-1 TaxID=3034151 RepID=UPI0023E20A76|nr:S4 domain-containing protein [Pedobacter sp. JY14-1]
MPEPKNRLNKYISEYGNYPRRAADRYISSGTVLVNGQIAKPNTTVAFGDLVTVEGKPVLPPVPESRLVFAYHKTKNEDAEQAHDLVRAVGRTDSFLSGLTLYTNDWQLAGNILRPVTGATKEFLLELNKLPDRKLLNQIEEICALREAKEGKQKVSLTHISGNRLKLVLERELHRQVRKVITESGFEISNFERLRIFNIDLDDLSAGSWRQLSSSETDTLYELSATKGHP